MAAVNYIGPVLITTSLDMMYAKGNPTYGSSKAGHEAFMASIAQELDGTVVTVNVLVPGGRANTNMIPRDTPFDRRAMIQPDVMQAPVVWLSSEASNNVHGRRMISTLLLRPGFPFSIQICLNGREWLAHQLGAAGLDYARHDNCFPWVEAWQRAQQLMDEQLKVDWPALLDGIARTWRSLVCLIWTSSAWSS